jgi:hypothetical protein
MKFSPRFLTLFAVSVPLISFGATLEYATYHSAGGLTSLICDGREFPLRGEFVVSFEGGVRATLQPHDQRSPITREGNDLHWKGVATFPNSGQAQFDVGWTENDSGVTLDGAITSGGPSLPGAPAFRFPLPIESADYVIDLPRTTFAGWTIDPAGTQLPSTKPVDPVFFTGTVKELALTDPEKNWRLALTFDQARAVSVTDVWEGEQRVYRLRVRVGGGLWPHDETWKLGLTLKLTGKANAPAAHLVVDTASHRYAFDGFGGNYCFNTETPVADYMLDHLQHAWVRMEFKGQAWDEERHTKPGPALTRDFELMQRVQKMGIPWILSLWRLPERYYADANQRPFFTFGRQIASERWPEFLDLLGSYLIYLKSNYGAEPDYFSFNEPDLGVNIGFTGETHREAIKRIGAHLASLGLKTKLLVGDTANPRDSHKFVLPTAADAAALRYVGAVSVHSWGGGTPAQYKAWGDVAAWLGLPLVVAEAGTDPGSFRNRMFDSYSYGLGEMQQYQELLRDSRPTTLIFWQFTEDYGLARVNAADKSVEPTGRFWLMKHFTNLTPKKSEVAVSSSDRPEVFVSTFVKGNSVVMHVLNRGPARTATLTGLPAGNWRSVTTTETESWIEAAGVDVSKPVQLPARSLTTLVRGE